MVTALRMEPLSAIYVLPPEEETVGRRLTMLRAQRGLTQDALAEQLGTLQKQISDWEREKTIPQKRMIAKIAAFFGEPEGVWRDLAYNDEMRREQEAEYALRPLRRAPALMIVPEDIESEDDPRFQDLMDKLRKYLAD